MGSWSLPIQSAECGCLIHVSTREAVTRRLGLTRTADASVGDFDVDIDLVERLRLIGLPFHVADRVFI